MLSWQVFPRHEKRRLASIVYAHRGKILAEMFPESQLENRKLLLRLAIVLRLAVIFHRSRVESTLPSIGVSVKGDSVSLSIPDQWLNEHPLTINDLEQEASYLVGIGINLQTERKL